MKPVRIYVAGPYSAGDVMTVLGNMRNGIKAAERLFNLGFAPFCPWFDYHFELMAEHPKERFYNYSMRWLEVADAVMTLEGWEESKGAREEAARARELGIPVYTESEFYRKYA